MARHLYIEPIGGVWSQTALLAAVIQTFSGNSKKRVSPSDYLPILGQKKTASEMLEALTRSHRGDGQKKPSPQPSGRSHRTGQHG